MVYPSDGDTMGSFISYALALGGIVVTFAPSIESATLLVSLGILIIRLIYDAFRLWRFITRK